MKIKIIIINNRMSLLMPLSPSIALTVNTWNIVFLLSFSQELKAFCFSVIILSRAQSLFCFSVIIFSRTQSLLFFCYHSLKSSKPFVFLLSFSQELKAFCFSIIILSRAQSFLYFCYHSLKSSKLFCFSVIILSRVQSFLFLCYHSLKSSKLKVTKFQIIYQWPYLKHKNKNEYPAYRTKQWRILWYPGYRA
jgi:hypothetical protein